VRLGHLGERHAGMDRDLHRAARNDVEEVVAHGENVLAPGEMREQQLPRGEERAILLQEHDVERLDRSRRRAEADEIAEAPQAIERGREGRFADAVVDDVAALAVRDLPHARGKVLLAVLDDVVAAVLARELGLLGRADRADDGRAEVLRPLRQADAARRCVYEDGMARLDAEGAAQEILRRQSLQHHRGAGLEIDGVGQVHEEVSRHDALLGIGAERPDIGHAVGDAVDALADRDTTSRPLPVPMPSNLRSGSPYRPATIRQNIKPIWRNFRKETSQRRLRPVWLIGRPPNNHYQGIAPLNLSSGIPSRTLNSGQFLKPTSKNTLMASSGVWPRSDWRRSRTGQWKRSWIVGSAWKRQPT
jgi:hypothetical protein